MIFLFMDMIDDTEECSLFMRIFYECKDLCFKVVNDIVKNEVTAEDIVQETFIKVAENIKRLAFDSEKDVSRTKNFITITAKRRAINQLEYEKRRAHCPLYEEILLPDNWEDITVENDDIGLIDIIKSLDPEYFTPIMYRYGYGMSDPEIARTMNISQENVRQRISRGRKKLAAILAKDRRLK